MILTTPSAGEGVTAGSQTHWQEYTMVQPLQKTVRHFLQKLIILILELSNCILTYKEMKTYFHKAYIHTFLTVLLAIDNKNNTNVLG